MREVIFILDYTTVTISLVVSAKTATTGEVNALAKSRKKEKYWNIMLPSGARDIRDIWSKNFRLFFQEVVPFLIQ